MSLKKNIQSCKYNPIIAEIKVHSPKYGDLLRNRDPIQILHIYEECGVAGISYITEPRYFKGSKELLRKITNETSLPVLRKDFIENKDDIEETSALGATAVLLIARRLKEALYELVDYAKTCGLEPLVEVHSLGDLRIALESNTDIIGINNRDITQLEKDDGSIEITKKLATKIPPSYLKISESGITSVKDLKEVLRYTDAALIGTAFMKSSNLKETVLAFVRG